MQKLDLREYKKLLRLRMRAIRSDMPAEIKEKRDRRIFEQVISLREYRDAQTVITYVSNAIEVDTFRLIRHSLEIGKKVAVPRCHEEIKGKMSFHFITSLEQLEKGKFGVLEPIPSLCPEVTDWSRSICIVPALCYDSAGYRLGYGGGYYDRFLSQYKGKKVGIVYTACMTGRLTHGRYDVPVDTIVTDRFIRNTKSASNPRKPRNKKRFSYGKGIRSKALEGKS